MAHWSENPSDHEKFERDIMDTQVSCGYECKGANGETLPGFVERLQAWPFHTKLTNFLTPLDAVLNFQDWLLHRYIGGAKVPGLMRFEVSITYKLPPLAAAASVTFGCSAVLPSANPDLRDRAYEWLTFQCNQAYAQFMERPLQTGTNGASTAGKAEFKVLALVHTFDKNEHVFKCKGGQFSAHGLRVYPELLRSIGLDPDKLPMGETIPKKQWSASIGFNKEGKAYKVEDLRAIDG